MPMLVPRDAGGVLPPYRPTRWVRRLEPGPEPATAKQLEGRAAATETPWTPRRLTIE